MVDKRGKMISNTIKRRIEWGDCDPAGIVFNPNFFRWLDHSTEMLYETAGWPKYMMVKHFNIVGCPIVESFANFLGACQYGSNVEIKSQVTEIGNSSFKIKHLVINNGLLCVEATETRVWTVKDPESDKLSSKPLPPEIVEAFSAAS